jgi:hypothetical protein
VDVDIVGEYVKLVSDGLLDGVEIRLRHNPTFHRRYCKSSPLQTRPRFRSFH